MKRMILLFFCLVSVFAGAQGVNSGLYTVDYKLLLALHPKMASYDMVLERHLRSDINFADMERLNAINMQVASLSIEANRRVEKLSRELDKVAIELSRIENRMTGNILEFDDEKKQFQGDNTRRSQLVKMTQLQAKQREIENQIIKIWDEVMNPLYLTRAQTKQIVDGVINEIDLLLESFSRQLGGAVILDSDYQSIQFAPQRITSSPAVGASPLSVRLYQSLLNSDLVGSVPDVYKNDPELSRYASGMRRDIEAAFDRNIATQISKSPLFSKVPELRGRLVLSGAQGLDLTRKVLEAIFQKHAVRADIASRILSQVR